MRYRFLEFVVDTELRALLGPDGPVPLRRRSFHVLEQLLMRAPAVVGKWKKERGGSRMTLALRRHACECGHPAPSVSLQRTQGTGFQLLLERQIHCGIGPK
jgi:hypothetical protein